MLGPETNAGIAHQTKRVWPSEPSVLDGVPAIAEQGQSHSAEQLGLGPAQQGPLQLQVDRRGAYGRNSWVEAPQPRATGLGVVDIGADQQRTAGAQEGIAELLHGVSAREIDLPLLGDPTSGSHAAVDPASEQPVLAQGSPGRGFQGKAAVLTGKAGAGCRLDASPIVGQPACGRSPNGETPGALPVAHTARQLQFNRPHVLVVAGVEIAEIIRLHPA